MIGKPYAKKIPKRVRNSMQTAIGGQCFLVKKLETSESGEHACRAFTSCHSQVQNLVDTQGGKRIQGWQLFTHKTYIDLGIYLWVFHSIWQTPEGEHLDLTVDIDALGGNSIVFWPDPKRKVDLSKGYNFNSLLVCETEKGTEPMTVASSTRIQKSKLYWATADSRNVLPYTESDGIYRYLTEEYAHNRQLFKQRYSDYVEFDDDNSFTEVKPLPARALLEFSITRS